MNITNCHHDPPPSHHHHHPDKGIPHQTIEITCVNISIMKSIVMGTDGTCYIIYFIPLLCNAEYKCVFFEQEEVVAISYEAKNQHTIYNQRSNK